MSKPENPSPSRRSAQAGRPRLPAGLLHRAQLLDRLSQGLPRRLTLVTAPAGSGKTTLLAQWADQIQRRCFWLALSEAEADFESYLLSLLAALELDLPGVSQTTLVMLRRGRPTSPAQLAAALSSDLESVDEPSILILDNYERVSESAAHEFTGALIAHLPPSIHPVISTRLDPPVALARLRAADQLAEVRAADLYFTQEECRDFLRRALKDDPPARALEAIVAQSHGWPAGVRLGALFLSGSPTVDPERLSTGRSRFVMDYFLEEVLAKEGPEIVGFLLRSSILDRLSVPLTSTVTSVSSVAAAEFLDYLERNSLFVFALDGRDGWYRVHTMLRETLRRKLDSSETPQSIAQLHRLASEWYAVNGPVTDAIRHALLAGDPARACSLAEQTLLVTLGDEDLLELERLLDLLPMEAIQQRPTLLAIQARLLGTRSGWREALPMLRTARDVLDRSPGPFSEHERVIADGLIELDWTPIHFFSGDLRKSQESAERVIEALRGKLAFGEGWARLFLSLSHYLLGDPETSQDILARALEEGRAPGQSHIGSFALMGLAFTHLLAGRLAESERAAAAMLTLEVSAGRQSLASWARYLLGVVAYETNRLAEARQHFGGVMAAGAAAPALAMLDARFGAALACVARGEAEEGMALLDDTERYILEGSSIAFLPSLHSFRARVAMIRGDNASARTWLDVTPTRFPPGPMLFFEVPPLTAARSILAETGRQASEAGIVLLGRVEARCKAEVNLRHLLPTLALQALALARLGRRSDSLKRLEQAVDLGRVGGFVRSFVDLGPPLANLLQEASLPPRDSAYVDRLMAAFGGAGVTTDGRDARAPRETLTPRELEILSLLQRRLTNDEIATSLGISVLTVKRHTGNLYAKLDVGGRREVVRRAIALGLLPAD